MRQLLKRLGKMVVGYGAITWAGPFLSFIFTPIITRILNPSDYGVADYALTIASSVGTVIAFAQPQALTAHFNDRADDGWKHRLLGGALVIAWAIGLPVGIALFLGATTVSRWAFQDESHQILFQLIGLAAVFGVSNSILTAAAQASLRVRWGMLFSIASLGVTVLGNVAFIIVFRLGATGMVLTPLVTGMLVGLLAMVVMRKTISMPTGATLKLLLRSGAVLLPTMLAYWVLLVVDRLFLVRYVSTEAMGHYAIANRIASLMTIALTPLALAWTPLALSIQNEANAKERYVTIARYLIAAALAASLFLGLFATEILILLTRPSYLPAAPYVGFLTYIYVFSMIATVLTTGAMVSKQLTAISLTVVAGALVNIGLNTILIPAYGVWGATIATVIGFAVPQVLLYVWLDRRYPTPYPLARLLAVFAVQCGLLVIGMLLPPIAFPIRIAIKAGLFLMLPIAYVVFGVVSRFELRQAALFVGNQWSTRFRGASS
jgi:O-antigen/teichoic acid export membrane protein